LRQISAILCGKIAALDLLNRSPVFSVMFAKGRCFLAGVCLTALATQPVHGVLLFQDGFNYPTGGVLASNTPWNGSGGSALRIAEGSLFYSILRNTTPPGGSVSVGQGYASVACINFTNFPVTSGSVYCSFLLNVSTLPTRTTLVAALLPGGSTAADSPHDPLDLSIKKITNGFGFTLNHTGLDPVSTSTALPTNTTHLIVIKYTFGNYGHVYLYIDPTPGDPEPATPAAKEGGDDDGTDAPNLQVLLLSGTGASSQGAYLIDTLRIGTGWSSVTPVGIPVAISGPSDQAICAGDSASFSVSAVGSPPLSYQWRTNGTPVPDATNDTFTLASPGPADTLIAYDIIVAGPYGSATSAPAALSISYHEPQITLQPTNAIVWPRQTNATFSASASGDEPLAYQWRTNQVPIPGATNNSYTLTNVSATDSSNTFDLLASNPCGVATSLPVSVLFAHSFVASEGLPGFFSGMNLITTNTSGEALFAWSSADTSIPIYNWSLEGPLSEQPLNDGTGKSIYSINVNPATALVYYLIGSSLSPPYVSPAAVNSVTTDSFGNEYFAGSDYAVTPAGLLVVPGAQPTAVIQTANSAVQVSGFTIPGSVVWLQMTTNLAPPVDWITIATNTAGADGVINFSDTIAGTVPGRFYRLVSP